MRAIPSLVVGGWRLVLVWALLALVSFVNAIIAVLLLVSSALRERARKLIDRQQAMNAAAGK